MEYSYMLDGFDKDWTSFSSINEASYLEIPSGSYVLKVRYKKDVFNTVIVVTDRVNLDKQIRDTIKQFMQVSSTVGWAKDASTLSTLMEQGKKIIITIVHKFSVYS